MRPFIIATCFAALLAVSPGAHAQTAQFMAAACAEMPQMRMDDDGPPTPGQAVCLGTFLTYHWFASVGELRSKTAPFCIPLDDVTTNEVIRTFVDYVRAHREVFWMRAQFVMDLAMHDRWPC
jgi:hypothetical protein